MNFHTFGMQNTFLQLHSLHFFSTQLKYVTSYDHSLSLILHFTQHFSKTLENALKSPIRI
jgi:hypothetical protein